MAINKVEFGGETLMDLTGDTVTPNNLFKGETAHDKSGKGITGAVDLAEYAKKSEVVPKSGGTFTGNIEGKYGTFTWLMTTAATTKNNLDSIAVIDPAGWIYKMDKSALVQDVIDAIPAAEGGSY